nr:golgin subfamily A member 1-like [Nothobranchius furzeri]
MATGGPHVDNLEVFSDILKVEFEQKNELLQRDLRDLEARKLLFGDQKRDFQQMVDAFEKKIACIRESLRKEKDKLETKTQDLEKRERHFEDQQKKRTNHVDELKTNSQEGRDHLVSTQFLDEHRVKIELEDREQQKQGQEIQDEWNKIKETQIANCESDENFNETKEEVGDLWKALQESKERSTEEINNLKRDLERQKLEFIEFKEQTERELTAEKQTLRDERERLNAGKMTLQNQIVEFEQKQTESEQIRQILLKEKLDVQLLRENLQEDKMEFVETAEEIQKDFNKSLNDLKEKLEFLSVEKRSLEEEKQRFLMTKSESEMEQGRIYEILQEELDNLHLGKQSLETQVTDFREEIAAAGRILEEKETALEEGLEGLRLQRETLEEEKTNFLLTKFRWEEENEEIQAYLQQELKRLRAGQQSLDKQMTDSEERNINPEPIIQDIQRVLQEERDRLVTLRQNLEEEKQRFLMTKSESEMEQGRIYDILQEELDNLHLGKQSLETQVMDFREEIAAAGKILEEKETALEEGLEGLRLQRETLEEEKTNFLLTKFRWEEENKAIQAKELEKFQIRQQTLIKQMTDSEERNINPEPIIQGIQWVLQEERDCLVMLPQNLEEEELEFMETREAENHLLKEKQRAMEEEVELLTQEKIIFEARMDDTDKKIGRILQLFQEDQRHLDQIRQELKEQPQALELNAASLNVEDEQPPVEDGSDSPTAASEDLGERSLEKTKTNSEEEHKEKHECFLDEFQYLEAGNQSLEEQKMDSQENEKDSAQILQEAQTLADHVLGTEYSLGTQYLGTQQGVRGHLLLGTQYRGPGYAACPHNDETQTMELREEMQKASLNVEDEQPPVEDESDSPTAASEDLGERSLEKTVSTQVPSDGYPTVPGLHDDNDELPENPGPVHGSAEEAWEAEEPRPSTSGLGSSWDQSDFYWRCFLPEHQ